MEQYVIRPAGEAESEAIHVGLRAYNRKFVPDTGDLSLAVKDADGRVVGGCDAFRMGDLVFVDVLWVEEGRRGAGLGGRILDQVEAAAARQGARRVELNTFGFQAPGFYEKRGYRRIGALEPAVGEYGHFFYAKELNGQ